MALGLLGNVDAVWIALALLAAMLLVHELAFRRAGRVRRAVADPDAIDYDALLADPRMQERVDPSRPRGQLFPACDLEGTGFALPARRTVQTVAAFGEQGVVQSICDPTFGRALRGITSRLGELIRRRRCR